MTNTITPLANRFVTRATRFLSGGRFPAFAICALLFYQIFIAVMAFAPPPGGAWSEFLDDFRMRCFKLDPKTGWMEMSSVWVMLSELFESNLRTPAVSVCTAVNWMTNWAVTRTFPLFASVGLGFAYALYSVFAVVAFIFVLVALPETKGRELP